MVYMRLYIWSEGGLHRWNTKMSFVRSCMLVAANKRPMSAYIQATKNNWK